MTTFEYVIPQLPFIAPMLLVYLMGVILSFVKIRRYAKPATFALIGCGMLFLITALFPFVQGYIFVSRHERMWADREVAHYLSVVGIVRTVFHVTAFSLILAAIFTGRRSPHGADHAA